MTMDAGQFRGLVDDHQNMVFSIALRLTRDRADAEEVAQDVFLELFRSAGRLTGDDHTRFWLRRVAVHRSTDLLRRRRVRPDIAAEEWTEASSPSAEVRWSDSSAALALDARIDELVTSLPENFRVPVVLRYGEDMTPEEIATMLGQPLATVKSNLRRGLEMMRRKAAVTLREHIR